MFLVVAATDNRSDNEQVSKDAHSRQMPVNVVDDPDLCSFILPAIVDRSPMMIAISSGGQSPVLARILRSKIESSIPAAYGRLGKLVGQFRDKVKARFSNIDERRTFWEEVLQGPAAELVFSGQEEQAAQYLADQIARPRQGQGVGEVYLVGAGPGDPDLLTFKALRLMQKADVVLYDRLVAPEIVDLTRRDAERIYVGKARANHAMPQQSINQLLLDLALEGKTVVRLKGGDPFIFGRGGEEIELLAQHQVPFQVVPGVTAASGCAAYSGIPLTHRDYAQSVRFITGHLKNNTIDLEWQELAQGHQTLVFYMGLVGLPIISQKLVEHGRSADTPVAIVQKGTTSEQRVLIGTLSTIAEQVAAEQIKAPTLLIIGEVVNLHSRLNWFTPGLAMRD
jgi:uroporphyrin-III C-methyltransferase/precorrin-2 dehydrogenase/sirohydrochlorin ferrochelatase